jgi:ribose 5-phosphate isomerase B
VRIGIGSDSSGLRFKENMKASLRARSHAVEDVCASDVAPSACHFATDRLASAIGRGRVERGILICSGAIGASIAANKHPRVRAAFCHEVRSVQRGVEEDNMNFLVLEAQAVTHDFACKLADIFINASCSSRDNRFGIPPLSLARVVERIKSNLDKPLEVGELSEVAEMSQSHFSKLFKHSTDLTHISSSSVNASIVPRNFCVKARQRLWTSRSRLDSRVRLTSQRFSEVSSA